uniref:Uncharacterized protein n=1 Tax=Anguilla anguilla TaxID=7936 RepID=A0A0E9XE52_ANGAN
MTIFALLHLREDLPRLAQTCGFGKRDVRTKEPDRRLARSSSLKFSLKPGCSECRPTARI